MIPLRLSEIAAITGGRMHGDDVWVRGAAYVDNRTPVAEGLFVAVVGERVDGHEYAVGAHAVLGSRPTDAPTVVVDDPVAALGRLARAVVEPLPAWRFAMTGSQGKTSTKDLLSQVLAADGPTVATLGNNNNELGVPLTALRADAGTRHLVLEMGARGIGHIAYLCEIAPPHVAAVLNVGTAHLGEFGSREAIAQAKGEIVEGLPHEGVAVLNGDDALVAAMRGRTRARVVTFGRGDGADVSIVPGSAAADEYGRSSFQLRLGGVELPVQLQVSGAHQVGNALAAAAMAHAAGLAPDVIAAGLSAAAPASRWRMETSERADGLLVVNDSYNANPDSMEAALDTVAALGRRRGGRAIAVLGVMFELGAEHDAAHRRVGAFAGDAGFDAVVVVGEDAAGIADGAREHGVGEVIVTASRDAAVAWVRENARAEDVVLVKASRGAALEVVAEGLLAESEGEAPAR